MESEADYRKKIQALFDHIQGAMEDVDPDLAECEQVLGSLTISFPDGSRCILSAQPSVRQLWMALAREGRAHHFNLAPSSKWIDDKDSTLELLEFLRGYLQKAIGSPVRNL